MEIQQIRVGGPLVGNRPHSFETDIPSWEQFEPIITPEIFFSGQQQQQQKPQRFILLPHQHFIRVIAYKTGIQIANFVPSAFSSSSDPKKDNDDDDDGGGEEHYDDDDPIIECVCLANHPTRKNSISSNSILRDIVDRMDTDNDDTAVASPPTDDIVVLAGCQDGTIREFSLSSLVGGSTTTASNDCGPYQVSGPCYGPRRVIRVSKPTEPIMHITAPALLSRSNIQNDVDSEDDNGSLVYVAIRTNISDVSAKKKGKREESKLEKSAEGMIKETIVNVSVFRLLVNHFDGETNLISLIGGNKNDTKKQEQRKTRLDQVKCRVGKGKSGNFLNTTPFRLLSTAKKPFNQGGRGGGGGGSTAGGILSHPRRDNISIFVVLARANSIHVYYEQIGPSKNNRRVSPSTFPISESNPITSINISLNNTDIVCGHYKGDITFMNNVLADVERYQLETSQVSFQQQRQGGDGKNRTAKEGRRSTTSKPCHTRSSFISSTVHWHSHPVTSITYDPICSPMDPILYSGGEESVLVSWQISKGKDRPVDVLPRLALGGIVHTSCTGPFDTNPCNGILVYSEDNTLQLFQSHSKGQMWKIYGLSSYNNSRRNNGFFASCDFRKNETQIEADPRACGAADASLVITGAPDAQGFIQWYDPVRERLTEFLEVAPFNRISRAERGDDPLPSPMITKHAFCDGGKSLITLDTAPSENVSVGAHEIQGKEGGEEYGIVTTIRFWSLNSASSQRRQVEDASSSSPPPYILDAAMTYPHGPRNRVTGLAITKDGSMACTVSNDEKAFRVWQRISQPSGSGEGDDEEDGTASRSSRIPAWICRFKVTIPAGFSNMPTSRDGVSFSDDGSTLAICFGSMVTLWDAKEARYLSSMCHFDCSENQIDSVQFVSTGLVSDFLLTKSERGVSFQSPFGSKGRLEGWKWAVLPKNVMNISVTDVSLVDSHAAVAISVYNSETDCSRLVFIDAASGEPGLAVDESDKSIKLIDRVDACLTSICSVGKYEVQSSWVGGGGGNDSTPFQPLMLYSLTESGELVCFRSTAAADSQSNIRWKGEITERIGPTLDVAATSTVVGDNSRKRTRQTPLSTLSTSEISATKRKAVEVFGLVYADEQNKSEMPSTADLPSLSSNFVRSFVSRSLSKNRSPR